MLFTNLTDQITAKMLRDQQDQQRSATLLDYTRRYDELIGDVFKSEHLERIWPKYRDEKIDEYKERRKIWVPWPALICSKIVSICYSEKVQRKWVDVGAESGAEPSDDAKRANDLQERMDEADSWDHTAQQVAYNALGIGEVSLWPEWRAFDKFTGLQIDLPHWTQFFPWIAEPVVLYDHADEIIGALKYYYLNSNQAHPVVTGLVKGGSSREIIELWLSPRYDIKTGQEVHPGCYREFRDDLDNSPPEFAERNWYGCCPVVFFKGPDPDETQHRGASVGERFERLAYEHSRTISTIGQAIDVLPNIWVAVLGEKAGVKELALRHNQIIPIMSNGEGNVDFRQAARELNLTEDWRLAETLAKLIGLVAQIPYESIDTLSTAGKVESGVALRILFQPIKDMVNSCRAQLGKAERERMRVAVHMQNYHVPSAPIKLEYLRPEVMWNEDLIPVNEAEQIVSDLALLAANVTDLGSLVKKYNPQITTDEQAEAFLANARKQQETVKPQAQRPSLFIPSLRNQNQSQNREEETPK